MIRAVLAALGVAVWLAALACGASTAPASPSSAPVASTSGRVVDALTDAGVPGIVIAGDRVVATTSDADGNFSLGTTAAGTPQVGFSGGTVVSRQTNVRVPGPAASVTLIPASFDLRAFDEMFRVNQLLRWTDAPPLLIETRTLQFTGVNDADFTALEDQMTDAEYAALAADLQWALPQLTGGRFTSFASVTRQTSTPGAHVHILNTGSLTVARYIGLTTATGFWGYSRWFARVDGAVTSGESMLDRDFERSGTAFLRSLRAHELGHSLGLSHVTVRASVMNAAARLEPNDFDRQASRIAFQRPPGNRTPDSDPGGIAANRVVAPGAWSSAIP